MATAPLLFLHFTSARDAAAIVETGRLLPSRTIVGTIYAAAVGGRSVPGVQRGGGSADAWETVGREVAVVFQTETLPEVLFPEEAIWRVEEDEALPIVGAFIVPADEAVALLDDAAGIPDDGVWDEALAALAARVA